MGKHRLVPHFIVEGSPNAIDFHERAFGAEKADVMMAPSTRMANRQLSNGDIRDG
jgi:uncharacterized glyoxalase superfamily protein PhnB